MASIIDITNPLTGAVEKVDQLDHTAQEIDSAVSRALPGGEIDITLANKAASGFGYGDSISYQFTGDSDGSKFDNAINAFLAEKKAGIFQIKFQSNPFLNTAGCVGTLWTFGDGKYAVLKGVSYFGELVQRTRYDGVWSPWEWVNPSLKIGVEYRTTERYLGKPVYVKLVDCGALPNATTKNVEYGDGVCRPIFGYGISTSGNTFPALNYGDSLAGSFNSSSIVSIWFNVNQVLIACGGDRSNINAYVFVKYWKATD